MQIHTEDTYMCDVYVYVERANGQHVQFQQQLCPGSFSCRDKRDRIAILLRMRAQQTCIKCGMAQKINCGPYSERGESFCIEAHIILCMAVGHVLDKCLQRSSSNSARISPRFTRVFLHIQLMKLTCGIWAGRIGLDWIG